MGRSGGRKRIKNIKVTRGAIFGRNSQIQNEAKDQKTDILFIKTLKRLSKKAFSEKSLERFPESPVENREIKDTSLAGLNCSSVVFRGVRFDKIFFSDESGQGMGADLSGAIFADTEIKNSSFSGCRALAVNFFDTTVQECHFIDTDLQGSRMMGTSFIDCLFTGADLGGIDFSDSNFSNSSFTLCVFPEEANFERAVLTDALFLEQDLSEFNFKSISAEKMDFKRCDIWGTVFEDAYLKGAVFRDVKSSEERPPSFKNARAQKLRIETSTIPNTDFSGSDLSEAVFRDSVLEGSDFEGADLTNASFYDCDLSGVNMSQQQIHDANFVNCTW